MGGGFMAVGLPPAAKRRHRTSARLPRSFSTARAAPGGPHKVRLNLSGLAYSDHRSKILYLFDFFGGRTRTRTWDPLIKSQLLYQLSYAPENARPKRSVL